MKEEWKVYTKGVPGKGNEVIKMLINLGAINIVGYTGDNQQYLYFINHKGIVDYTQSNIEKGQIIMDNYTELHLPEKWKDGDILFSEEHKEFAVFVDEWESSPAKFLSYFVISNGRYLTYKALCKKDFRLATKSEVAQFYESLRSVGKDWDTEKKQLVDWKWKPTIGDKYWIIVTDGVVGNLIWNDDPADNKLFSLGNCFRIREDAEGMLKKIKKLLKGEQL